MTVRKILELGLGIAISGFFIWLIARAIPEDTLFAALRTADPRWILAGFVCFLVGYTCRIWRWRCMLTPINPEMTWARASTPFMASIAANNILPFRAGDVLRTVGFSKWLGVPAASVLATMLSERLLDLFSILLLLALALFLFPSETRALGALAGASAWLLVVITLGILSVLLFPEIYEGALNWTLSHFGGRFPGFLNKAGAPLGRLFGTLRMLAKRSRMMMLLLWSLLAWMFEAGVFYCVARALPELAAPVAAWLAMPVGTLSTLLPSTPGYVGTFHYFVMTTTEMFGNSTVSALAFAVLVHLALWIPATLWGGASFAYWMLVRSTQHKTLNKKATP